METRLHFDNKSRGLTLHAKEHFVSDDNVVLTVQGKLDTSTGGLEGKVALRKKFFPEASNPWYTRADLGASYESTTDEILYGVDAKKCFELSPDGLLTLDTKGGLQMSASRKKVCYEARRGTKRKGFRKEWFVFVFAFSSVTVNARVQSINTDTSVSPFTQVWKGKVELSQKIFNFTEDQDLKIKLGYDIARRTPYGQFRENNWTLDTGKKEMQRESVSV